METESFFQRMKDGTEISVNRWIPDGNKPVKGIIQLSHGMAEHAMRYDRFGCILAENGYILNAHDFRGHGRTAQRAVQNGTGKFGILADQNGFSKIVDDLDEVILKVKKDFPGKRLILFGHSFGSFVAQAYIENYASQICGCILCGTAGPRPGFIAIGKCVADCVCAFRGRMHYSEILRKFSFSSYCNRISDVVNGQEWLSRDSDSVKIYLNDAWCGFLPSAGFYQDMTGGLKMIHKVKNMKKIPENLPLFVICGSDDPVGGYTKSVKKLVRCYSKYGIKSVILKIYPGARHELLNETNRDEVISDILLWIDKTI